MDQGNSGMGIQKHRKSGKVPNNKHFTGKKAGKQRKRKGKGLNKKTRRKKRGTHKNKYEQIEKKKGVKK